MRSLRIALIVLCLVAQLVYAQNCTDEDFTGEYSACKNDGTRDLLYFKNPSANCTGGAEMPANIFALPCNITCGDGSYLPLGATECASCLAGTYSLGGGERVDSWYSWPSSLLRFGSYCYNNRGNSPVSCPGWSLSGTYVRSGKINDSMTSVLVLRTYVSNPSGMIDFTYRVDSEMGFDGLTFYINGVSVLGITSQTDGYQRFNATLSSGPNTFRWEFSKDITISVGEDAAYIQSITVTGLSYADDYCEPCPAGEYQSLPGQSSCLKCPMNTAASEEGSSSCAACSSYQYAYPGSNECSPRLPCTSNDYEQLLSSCTNDQQTITYHWLQPQICSPTTSGAVPLPAAQTGLECGPCTAGSHRDAQGKCDYCPDGQASSDGETCETCPIGTAAVNLFDENTFNDWPTGSSTGCQGECSGSTGWRLRGTYLDSGSGLGADASSWYSLNVQLTHPGFVNFTYSLNCSLCQLQLTDSLSGFSMTYKESDLGSDVFTDWVPLDPGSHTLRWTFSQPDNDVTPIDRTNKAVIYNYVISGVVGGGAPECVPCTAGSAAAAGSVGCTLCPPGQQSNSDRSACVVCPAGYFSPAAGAVCQPCGPGTFTNANQTICETDCKFTTSNNVTYDFSRLKSDEMYGPVVDAEKETYYINVCEISHHNHTCYDDEGNAIPSYACQIQPNGLGQNIGQDLSYYELPAGQLGVIMNFQNGNVACHPPVARSTNLTLICDPLAGVGTLSGDGVVEATPCHYQFVWRSLYACPVCTERDYAFYYSSCQQLKRVKTYYWKEPRQCHDGVALPAEETVACSESKLICQPGYSANGGDTCVPCTNGTYSIGGGYRVNDWDPMPPGFSSQCSQGKSCSLWFADQNSTISSGSGNSLLTASYQFVRPGAIYFRYKLYVVDQGNFQFFIDGTEQIGLRKERTSLQFTNFGKTNISVGTHVFTWIFSNGRLTPAATLEQVQISLLYIAGTDYHDDTCSPCPAGWYSPAASFWCRPCPANTFSEEGSASCTSCPNNTYSTMSSEVCSEARPCTNDDIQKLYTPCVDGARTAYYEYLDPMICTPSAPLPANETDQDCLACPEGTLFQPDGSCLKCPPGEYVSGDESVCRASSPGEYVMRSEDYWDDNSLDALPANWTTGCVGDCGSYGWRIRDSSIDSGYHFMSGVDSWITYKVTIVDLEAYVRFTWQDFTAFDENGLQLLIDGRTVSIPAPLNQNDITTFQRSLSVGSHNITWNYHQEPNTEAGIVALYGVSVTGTADGIGSLTDCPPGTYTSGSASTSCKLCEPGHYSNARSAQCPLCPINYYTPVSGSEQCILCGAGTYATEPGSTSCSTNCKFNNEEGIEFDLNGLPAVVGPVVDMSNIVYYFSVCQPNAFVGNCTNHDDDLYTHVCSNENGDTVSRDWGNSLSFVPLPTSTNDAVPNFIIKFGDGDDTACAAGERTTTLQFYCDVSRGIGHPTYLFNDGNCSVAFAWQSQLGCPVCTSEDYIASAGPCTAYGTRQISYTRSKACNGPLIGSSTFESCSSVQFPVGLLVSIIIVCVVLISVAVFIGFKHKRLSAQYQQLLGSGSRVPESAMEMSSSAYSIQEDEH